MSGANLISWFAASGGRKVANFMMMQQLSRNYGFTTFVPQIMLLPNGNTVTLASHQPTGAGTESLACLTVIDNNNIILANKCVDKLITNRDQFMYNSALDNNVQQAYAYATGDSYFATFNGTTYTYGSFGTISSGGANNMAIRYARARSGKVTAGVSDQTNGALKFDGTTITCIIPGFGGSWLGLSANGQADVDSSSNLSFCTKATAGGGDALLFGRITGASYNAYSFWTQASVLTYQPMLSMQSDNSALIAANNTAGTAFDLFKLSATPSMANHYTYNLPSGAFRARFVAIDDASLGDAYVICQDTQLNQIILLKITISTGVVVYAKAIVFSGWAGYDQVQVHLSSNQLMMSAVAASGSASTGAVFFAKLSKSAINNGTYTIPGLSGTVGQVVVSDYAGVITKTTQSNTALTPVAVTRGTVTSVASNQANANSSGDFFTSAAVTA